MTSSRPRSKRRSATNRISAPRSPPTFFTDRDLGKSVPQRLREEGLTVEAYRDHFSRDDVADNEWLRVVAQHGWVALSHDRNIQYDREAVRVHMENRGRLFIVRGKGNHSALAETILAAQASMEKLLAKETCFIAKIHQEVRKGEGLHASVSVRLTLEQWLQLG
jgi:hypothetical protein